MPIPGSTHVQESRVISGNAENVWELVRSMNFSWLSSVKQVKTDSPTDLFAPRIIHYKDGTVQTIKLLELSDVEYFVTYEVIASEPAISVTSAIHTIRLRKVTFDNTTFVEWTSDYSSDATQEVIQDSKYKKHEGLQDLSKAVVECPCTNCTCASGKGGVCGCGPSCSCDSMAEGGCPC